MEEALRSHKYMSGPLGSQKNPCSLQLHKIPLCLTAKRSDFLLSYAPSGRAARPPSTFSVNLSQYSLGLVSYNPAVVGSGHKQIWWPSYRNRLSVK